MTPSVVIVYAEQSKMRRKLIVSMDEDLMKVVPQKLSPGESVIEVPPDIYDQAKTNVLAHGILDDWLASQIGSPTQDDRCVEVDKNGVVIAVYRADPLIDRPRFNAENTVELHTVANIGDSKVGKDFVSAKQPALKLSDAELIALHGSK